MAPPTIDTAGLPFVSDISIEPTPVPETKVDLSPPPPESVIRISSSSATARGSADSAPTVYGVPSEAGGNALQPPAQQCAIPLSDSPNPSASLAPPSPTNGQGPATLAPSVNSQSSTQSVRHSQSQSQTALPYSSSTANSAGKDPRRFSFPSFAFLRSDTKLNATQAGREVTSRPLLAHLQPQAHTKVKDMEKKSRASRAFTVRALRNATSEKRAKESATIVRSLIIGDHNTSQQTKTKKAKTSRSDIARVKSQLLQPKSASKVITQLRALPAHPGNTATNTTLPIRAVCLDICDEEAHEQHFAQLGSVATASVTALSAALADIHLIDLLAAPNMGFGAPVTAQGLFAGSVPTTETVIEGIEQITPQLLALGYATGRAVVPDHKGVIVPTDRISILTYWWGLELCLPPPTLAHLEAAESPSASLLNLLTAISVLNEGIREVLPFIRYFAQFVKSEWYMIKKADDGRGVVCTATWIMPAALVPRAWDFPEAAPCHSETGPQGQTTPTSPSVKRFSATLATPKPSTDGLLGAPRPSSAYSEETGEESNLRPGISSEPPVLPELVVSSPASIDGAPESVEREAREAHEKVQRVGGELVF
ncbi:hypothetical protein PAXRUDRAFT_825287 [Paxillus rubicundulus Ve08.2h10]|uniref:Uncharacterized protein n=1 Tax=Paxillus rubicundulus Ve08.2h10 TaxID=930991 RepID=A0A0D0EB41_9AGAM|nr:hypothetical protein PAXRUDRAFT_825287 [Paxillus rubicundulus Ve08.2h10]